MAEPHEHTQSAEDLFEQFLRYEALGMRKEAKNAVGALVEEVSSRQSKEVWTKKNLHRLPKNRASRVRHEIFKQIVFPVLKAAFERGDAEASYLFGKYFQNLYSDRGLFGQMGERTAKDFFRQAYETEPKSVQYQDAYLGSVVNELDYLFHEWPAGILVDQRDWPKAIAGLKAELALAESLDRNLTYSVRLAIWRKCTTDYEDRLSDGKERQ